MAALPGKLTVAYWRIRGLCAPLRMMAYFSGHRNLEVLCYDAGDPKSAEYKQQWFAVKPEVLKANALANLPYIQDSVAGETVTICQTNACIVYLGSKFGLNAGTAVEQARMHQVIAQTMDLRNAATGLFYSGSSQSVFDQNLPAHLQGLDVHLTKLEGFMEQNGTVFSASNKVTMSDFHLWEMLDQHEVLATRLERTSFLADYPRLRVLHEKMRAAPELAGYFASEWAALPLNNPHAVFK